MAVSHPALQNLYLFFCVSTSLLAIFKWVNNIWFVGLIMIFLSEFVASSSRTAKDNTYFLKSHQLILILTLTLMILNNNLAHSSLYFETSSISLFSRWLFQMQLFETCIYSFLFPIPFCYIQMDQ